MKKTLGQMLAQVRRALDLNQTSTAALLNIQQSRLSQLEQASTDNVTRSNGKLLLSYGDLLIEMVDNTPDGDIRNTVRWQIDELRVGLAAAKQELSRSVVFAEVAKLPRKVKYVRIALPDKETHPLTYYMLETLGTVLPEQWEELTDKAVGQQLIAIYKEG